MTIVKEICFWIVLTAGLLVSLIGIGMLLDSALKRYLAYKEIYSGFIEFMRNKVKAAKKEAGE